MILIGDIGDRGNLDLKLGDADLDLDTLDISRHSGSTWMAIHR